jgi:hypothetical protein
VVVSIVSGNFMYLLPALVLCLFCFCLCPCSHGLPDRPFTKCAGYDAKVLLMYLAALGAALIVLIALAFLNPT